MAKNPASSCFLIQAFQGPFATLAAVTAEHPTPMLASHQNAARPPGLGGLFDEVTKEKAPIRLLRDVEP